MKFLRPTERQTRAEFERYESNICVYTTVDRGEYKRSGLAALNSCDGVTIGGGCMDTSPNISACTFDGPTESSCSTPEYQSDCFWRDLKERCDADAIRIRSLTHELLEISNEVSTVEELRANYERLLAVCRTGTEELRNTTLENFIKSESIRLANMEDEFKSLSSIEANMQRIQSQYSQTLRLTRREIAEARQTLVYRCVHPCGDIILYSPYTKFPIFDSSSKSTTLESENFQALTNTTSNNQSSSKSTATANLKPPASSLPRVGPRKPAIAKQRAVHQFFRMHAHVQ